MKRQIVKIDEEICNGCGLCIPNCHEGALQIIDGKARLISDLMCDGLGACLGHCPEGAITIEEREAAPYDEILVIKDILPKGKNVLIAHLQHLKEHGETEFLKQAISYLEDNKSSLEFDLQEVKYNVHNNIKPSNMEHNHESGCGGGCPSSKTVTFGNKSENHNNNDYNQASELRQWPVQMHLINPMAPYFRNADVVLAADCVAFSLGSFHKDYLKGKSLAIACPKLDSDMEVYVEKLVSMINNAKINTLNVMIMEVPCCGGLLQIAKMALSKSERKIPIKCTKVSIDGRIISEDWI